jgi:hypothetical protein
MKTKHLLSGVAVIAALALSAPAWAQPANPSGGNSMGMPGPSPGGPGLTPYTTGAPPPAPTPSGQMPTGGRRTSGERIPAIMPDTSSPPSSASDTTSATPPSHRHARHMAQGKPSHHPSRFPNVQGDNSANELNQAELARLQTSSSMPPPAPMGGMPPGAAMPYRPMQPPTQGGNSMGMPGPNTGGPGLTPYTGGGYPPR